ncbi:ATP-binding protein [Novispirillum itersonii]|uniref:histidine kinase n=1 Tax=Novispirillum itersonii TaxID=189 RepID=A0A7W9ZIH1_NOVIT|nr:ATP-binding protein [Novispirillum itersonii]MBB6210869.1 PAS domain S-box-containing protein [Novispirillum itersonii]
MKRVLAGLVFVLGMGTTVLLAEVVTGNAEQAIHQVLDAQSRAVSAAFRLMVEERMQALGRLADRWAARGGVPEAEWRRDVRGYLKDYDALDAIEWVDASYVVRWAEPEEARRPMIGQNLGTEQRRRQALMAAIETRRPQMTAPIQLMGGGTGFLIYAPVFRNDVFEGVVVAVNRSGALVEHLAAAIQSNDGVALTVRHEDAVILSPRIRTAPRGDVVTTEFAAGGGRWSVEARPGVEMVRAYAGHSEQLVLVIGTGLTLLTALLLWLHGKSRDRLLDVQVREARLGLILDTAPDAILTFNEQGVIETSNAAAGKIFGLSASDVPGLHLNRLIIRRDADGREVAEDRIWEIAAGTQTSGALFGVRGWVEEFPVEISIAEGTAGDRRLFTAIVRDISVRVTTEAARRRAEDILKAALDTIPEGFVVYDDHDRLVICNEAYRTIYAASAPAIRPDSSFEEILRYGLSRGQYPQAGYTPEERQRWLMQRLRLHRNPSGALMQQTNDGRWLRIEERLTDQGYVVGLRTDVTDLMRAEETIRASETRLRSLMESSPVGAVLLTEQDVVLYANRRIADLFRMPDNAFSADFPETLYADPVARKALLADFERLGAVWDRPMRMCRRDGEEFWALISVSRAPEQLNAHRIVWVYDIDESKRLAMELEASRDLLQQQAKELADLVELNAKERSRAEAATRLKSEFLANVSHEIRTPMTGVLGLTDLLLASPLNDEQSVYATRLKRSGQTLLTLLNDILDFSKIEAGQLSLEQVDFSPVEVIEDVLTFLRPKAEEKRLSLRSDLPAPVDGRPAVVVVGDPTRLRQVLFNLIGNAIKFTEEGSVSVRLHAEQGLEPGMIDLMLEVQDTGIGIPPDRQQQVFEPFRQADSSTTRRFGGTGLGLAICRRLAELMGGEIRVFSRVGKGTTFTITMCLPEGSPEKAVSASTAASPMPSPVSGRSYRLLLAEDEETNRMLITIGLERLGHSVRAVPNGREAIAAIEEEDFDLLLLDMHMPLLDGPGVTSYVRMLPPPRCSMPVLALTADVLADQRRQYEEIGLDGYLTKPVDWQRMQETILYWCQGPSVRDGAGQSDDLPEGEALPAGAVAADVEPARRKAPPGWLREIMGLVGPERLLPLMRSAQSKLETGGEQVSCAFLRESLTQGREAAHSLKGVARQFGATQTGAVAEELELSPYLGPEDPALIDALSRLELAAQADARTLAELIRDVETGVPPA